MSKNILRWIVPFVVIALIAVYMVLSPAFTTHAAAPAAQHQHHIVSQHNEAPNRFWHP